MILGSLEIWGRGCLGALVGVLQIPAPATLMSAGFCWKAALQYSFAAQKRMHEQIDRVREGIQRYNRPGAGHWQAARITSLIGTWE
jgi:hypothetical protein